MSGMDRIAELLQSGIAAEGLRQKAIAGNIANLKTDGYRRLDIKFEQLLERALESIGRGDTEVPEAELYQPFETEVKLNGNDVSLEGEVGQMVKNSLRYKTYIRLLKTKYRQMELALNIK